MRESFNLILQSANSSNIIGGTSTANYVYFVNWGSIIPEKYRDRLFTVYSAFQSGIGSTTAGDCINVSVTLGNSHVKDQSGAYNPFVMSIYPLFKSTVVNNWYSCTTNDNVPFTCNYPNNSNITVQLTNISNGAVPNPAVQNYTLQLSFVLCDP